MQLFRLNGAYAIARLAPDAPVPPGLADADGFVSISRTDEELSLVAREEFLQDHETVEAGWVTFKLQGPFAFDEIGVIAGLSAPLVEAGLGIFVISTFDTDYILLKASDAAAAADAWRAQGHNVTEGCN